MAQRLIRALTESSLQWRVQCRVATTISGEIAMRFALDNADLPIPRPKPAEGPGKRRLPGPDDADMKTITRFAPSPTGPLHLGHAHSALFGWTAARDRGGVFLLRIEGIDSGRCRPEFERQLMDDMSWLGLTWPDPVRRQSEHFDDYRAALDRL